MIEKRCKECEHLRFEKYKSGPSRYYCNNPTATAGVGVKMISRCDRYCDELKTKTSPKWCPYRINVDLADETGENRGI